jgi:hypothetical protein
MVPPTILAEHLAPPTPSEARIASVCSQIVALDAEIAALEQTVALLPDVLAALARHPVLWLLLGREGIDRPGGLGTIVGQQVVTLVRRDWRVVLAMSVLMFVLGLVAASFGWPLPLGGH